MVYSHPAARSFIADALAQRVRNLHIEPDFVAGTALAAIGWAALVADRLDIPFVYIRKEAKGHGAKKLIEGDLKKGSDVVVVEDLFSTGGSAVKAVQALREEGECNVADVVGIMSYGFPSLLEYSQEHQVKFHPLATFSTLLEVAIEQDRISKSDADIARQFIEDPQHWSA